ncbi:NAD(P)-dependent alcohol dehydrogenase [Desulforamulus hydrothermalis]|uniref:Putative iditol dehydrogenase n=1 Tax=Desulforamulus hydrothermalis Lam5 = DSM 18033 TaxID=1121428 RepID=K8E042_9FIRM|nr:NAD(P)-dependent alcohol dehydrogenase [Desulforamulus hydrothermalis]CCO08832.1 putative iditol dehydrogenase [Desulforamulus hydrothermalis Lam5 = DSM 18033]SHG72708.1 L-iditol 2-dehydrogenase [Desulforamulus hydrothermalis Lam5 = DSM 18033]
MSKMKACVLYGPLDVRVQELQVPQLKPDQALVKVKAVGVCGSDVHYYEHGRIGRYVVEKPMILGHEAGGEVVAVGEAVTNLQVGQRVAIEPGVTCGKCKFCKEGRYNLCPDVEFLATPPYDGAFCEYLAMRADFLHPIPDHMSYEAASLAEPFSVGLHACRRAGVKPGDTVAVLGLGPVGLLTVVAAKAFGATKIIAADLAPIRLEMAKEMGATAVVNAQEQDVYKFIMQETGGLGVDAAIETAGSTATNLLAVQAARRGGKVALVGLPPNPEVPFNVFTIADGELDIFGIFRYANTYPTAVELLASGIASVEKLVTHRFTLDQAKDALDKARTDKQGSIKVMVNL